MKNLILALSLSLAIGATLTLNSCKKETSEDDSVSAQDAATVMGAMNLTGDDASASSGQVTSFTGKTNGLYAALCGASIVDTSTNVHQITITYDGTTHCYGIIRSGTVTITLTNGTHWQDIGAQLSVVYNNLKVTDVVSNATFTLNGTHVITNESGGLAWQLAYGLVTNTTDTHRNTSTNMSITFPNGAQRTWTFDRTRTWTSVTSGNSNVITVSDTSQAAGGVEISGVNRYGTSFTNTFIASVVSNNNANCPYEAYAGETQHHVASRTTTVTYGTNASGTVIGTPTTCGLGYYIVYVNASNGRTANRFVPYL